MNGIVTQWVKPLPVTTGILYGHSLWVCIPVAPPLKQLLAHAMGKAAEDGPGDFATHVGNPGEANSSCVWPVPTLAIEAIWRNE